MSVWYATFNSAVTTTKDEDLRLQLRRDCDSTVVRLATIRPVKPHRRYTSVSVMHCQYDARPTLTFLFHEGKARPSNLS